LLSWFSCREAFGEHPWDYRHAEKWGSFAQKQKFIRNHDFEKELPKYKNGSKVPISRDS